MASTVPASLKSADITRFAHRAAQLEKVKPAVAYWCNYWILNQILAKNLHNADSEALSYTTGLMDKVEQFKNANSTNDTVIDDMAGKAYIEQFGLETFNKADNAVRANNVSIGTADTFQAAATFLDLLGVWGPLDNETSVKVKYAKYHAIRIIKAIKAGEDPNLSNPKQEPQLGESLPQLDPNDEEVKALVGDTTSNRRASVVEVPDEADRIQARLARTSSLDQSLHPSREQSEARPPRPSVVEVPDEAHRIQSNLARLSSKDESLHPSRVPSRPSSAAGTVSPLETQDAAAFYTSNQQDVSPMEQTSQRKPSIGGNYFPNVSNQLPSAPRHLATSPGLQDPSFDLPAVPGEPTLPEAPSTFTSQNTSLNPNPEGHFIPPAPPGQTPQIPPNLAPQSAPQPQRPMAPPPQLRQVQPQQPQTPAARAPPAHQVVFAPPMNQSNPPPPIAHPVVQAPIQSNVVVDEEAIMKAQKHARWAISALNFEDVPTAVRELQGALAMLGAR